MLHIHYATVMDFVPPDRIEVLAPIRGPSKNNGQWIDRPNDPQHCFMVAFDVTPMCVSWLIPQLINDVFSVLVPLCSCPPEMLGSVGNRRLLSYVVIVQNHIQTGVQGSIHFVPSLVVCIHRNPRECCSHVITQVRKCIAADAIVIVARIEHAHTHELHGMAMLVFELRSILTSKPQPPVSCQWCSTGNSQRRSVHQRAHFGE